MCGVCWPAAGIAHTLPWLFHRFEKLQVLVESPGWQESSIISAGTRVFYSVFMDLKQTNKSTKTLLGENSPFSCQTTAKSLLFWGPTGFSLFPSQSPSPVFSRSWNYRNWCFPIKFWFWFSHTLGILLHELPLVVKAGKPITLLPCMAPVGVFMLQWFHRTMQ